HRRRRGGCSDGFASRAHSGTDPRDLDQSLREHFRFEFLNRFDQVVHFRPLGRPEIRSLAVKELGSIESRAGLRLRGLRLEVDEAVLDWLTVHGYDPYFGARYLHRTIERSVSSGLAELLVRGTPERAVGVSLNIRRGGVHASWVETEEPSATKTPVEITTGPSLKEHAKWTRAELDTEAARLSEQAEARLAALDEERQEYSGVLEEMNDPEFWNHPKSSREVLERFRDLDVSIRIQRRLARPLERIVELCADTTREPTTAHLRQAYEEASSALFEWDARHAESFARDVWIVLRAADPAGFLEGWVEELTTMELHWCQRLQLDAQVVAYHVHDGEVRGAAVEVRGPGAAGYLRMEEGLHRRVRKEGYDLRVRVDVVPRSSAPSAVGDPRPTKKVPRRFDLAPEWAVTARGPSLGLQEERLGEERETLAPFLSDRS
ncbi:MAG: PCRF domain-containing protein, partial [Planctomycetota bacterium]